MSQSCHLLLTVLDQRRLKLSRQGLFMDPAIQHEGLQEVHAALAFQELHRERKHRASYYTMCADGDGGAAAVTPLHQMAALTLTIHAATCSTPAASQAQIYLQ